MVAIGAAGAAMATPGEGPSERSSAGSEPRQGQGPHGQIKFKTRGPTDILVVTQTWQPGGHSGWHSHSGLILFTLKSGTISVFDGTATSA